MFGNKKAVVKPALDYNKPVCCNEQHNFFVVCDSDCCEYYYRDYDNACDKVLSLVMECIDSYNECVDAEKDDLYVYPTIADIKAGNYPYDDCIYVNTVDFED